jgi:hypothetical protein
MEGSAGFRHRGCDRHVVSRTGLDTWLSSRQTAHMSPARVGIPGLAMGMDVIVEMSKVGVLGLINNGTPYCSSISEGPFHFGRGNCTHCSTNTCGGTVSHAFLLSRSEFGRFCSQLAKARVAFSDSSCRVLLAMAALLYL